MRMTRPGPARELLFDAGVRFMSAPHLAGDIDRIQRADALAGSPDASEGLVEWAVDRVVRDGWVRPSPAMVAAFRDGCRFGLALRLRGGGPW